VVDGTDRQGDQERLRIHDGEEHAGREDQKVERRARSGPGFVIDCHEPREIHERDEEGEIRDEYARQEIGVIAPTQGHGQNTHEQRIKREVRVVGRHGAVAVVCDRDVRT
jgi:hypothetical protein